jgi:hypothetical protein
MVVKDDYRAESRQLGRKINVPAWHHENVMPRRTRLSCRRYLDCVKRTVTPPTRIVPLRDAPVVFA